MLFIIAGVASGSKEKSKSKGKIRSKKLHQQSVGSLVFAPGNSCHQAPTPVLAGAIVAGAAAAAAEMEADAAPVVAVRSAPVPAAAVEVPTGRGRGRGRGRGGRGQAATKPAAPAPAVVETAPALQVAKNNAKLPEQPKRKQVVSPALDNNIPAEEDDDDEYSTSSSSDDEPSEEIIPLVQWGVRRRRTGLAQELAAEAGKDAQDNENEEEEESEHLEVCAKKSYCVLSPGHKGRCRKSKVDNGGGSVSTYSFPYTTTAGGTSTSHDPSNPSAKTALPKKGRGGNAPAATVAPPVVGRRKPTAALGSPLKKRKLAALARVATDAVARGELSDEDNDLYGKRGKEKEDFGSEYDAEEEEEEEEEDDGLCQKQPYYVNKAGHPGRCKIRIPPDVVAANAAKAAAQAAAIAAAAAAAAEEGKKAKLKAKQQRQKPAKKAQEKKKQRVSNPVSYREDDDDDEPISSASLDPSDEFLPEELQEQDNGDTEAVTEYDGNVDEIEYLARGVHPVPDAFRCPRNPDCLNKKNHFGRCRLIAKRRKGDRQHRSSYNRASGAGAGGGSTGKKKGRSSGFKAIPNDDLEEEEEAAEEEEEEKRPAKKARSQQRQQPPPPSSPVLAKKPNANKAAVSPSTKIRLVQRPPAAAPAGPAPPAEVLPLPNGTIKPAGKAAEQTRKKKVKKDKVEDKQLTLGELVAYSDTEAEGEEEEEEEEEPAADEVAEPEHEQCMKMEQCLKPNGHSGWCRVTELEPSLTAGGSGGSLKPAAGDGGVTAPNNTDATPSEIRKKKEHTQRSREQSNTTIPSSA